MTENNTSAVLQCNTMFYVTLLAVFFFFYKLVSRETLYYITAEVLFSVKVPDLHLSINIWVKILTVTFEKVCSQTYETSSPAKYVI